MIPPHPIPAEAGALSPREITVLHALAQFRFLTSRHVEALLFLTDRNISPASRPVLTRRTLESLRDRRLVTRTDRAVGGSSGGSGAYAYYLTPKGGRAIAGHTHTAARRTAPRGTFLMRHALAAADVALAFMREAARRAGHEMLLWESDWEIAQRAEHQTIIPDAYIRYASDTTELHGFLEIDLGTAGSRVFQNKVERYLDLYRSGRWQSTLELWPAVLTVTPTPTRAALLKRATETVLNADPKQRVSQQTEFAFTDLGRITTEGPLARIWQLAGQQGSHQLLPDPRTDHDRKENHHGNH